MNFLGRILVAASVLVAWLPGAGHAASRVDHLQRIVDDLRARLGVSAVVTVSVVERDARLVSVRRDPSGDFTVTVQRDFAEGLAEAQLEAALAHELGHVWIHTHHPYLQTEELANRVALRVVTREQLVAVYRGVWGADAVHGDLATFLGLGEAARSSQR